MSNIEIHSDLIRGHIDTIILKALFDGDRYGYDIIKEIEQKSNGQYQLKQPTLYSCLKRLEEQGFTSSYWSNEKTFGGRKKYYTLTPMGKEVFLKHQREWLHSKGIIDCLISDETTKDFASMAQKNIAAYYDNNQSQAELDGFELTAYQDKQSEDLENEFLSANQDSQDNQAGYTIYDQDSDKRTNIENNPYTVYPENYNSFENLNKVESSVLSRKTITEEESDNTYELDEKTGLPKRVSVDKKVDSDINDVLADFSKSFSEKSYVGDITSKQYVPDSPAPYISCCDNDDGEVPYEEYKKAYDDVVELPYQDTMQQVDEKPEPQAAKSENSFPQFIKYNSPNKIQPIQLSDDDVIKRDYRSALEKLASAKNHSVKSHQEAKLEKLTETALQMGDQVIIRRHDNTIKEYNAENYYYKNKLRLFTSFIMYCIVLVEILAMLALHHFTFSSFTVPGAIENSITPLAIYIACAVAAFIFFPFLSVVLAFNNMDARNLINFDIKASIIFRAIVVALSCTIIFFINHFWGMLNNDFVDYVATFLLPSLLILNFLISLFVSQAFLKSGRFNVKS